MEQQEGEGRKRRGAQVERSNLAFVLRTPALSAPFPRHVLLTLPPVFTNPTHPYYSPILPTLPPVCTNPTHLQRGVHQLARRLAVHVLLAAVLVVHMVKREPAAVKAAVKPRSNHSGDSVKHQASLGQTCLAKPRSCTGGPLDKP